MTNAPFKTLGLAPGASPAEVKAAFRRLALRAHPDRGGDPGAFEELRRAYSEALRRAETEPCPECDGRGTVSVARNFMAVTRTCLSCLGRGKKY